jgi:hypothetical protein
VNAPGARGLPATTESGILTALATAPQVPSAGRIDCQSLRALVMAELSMKPACSTLDAHGSLLRVAYASARIVVSYGCPSPACRRRCAPAPLGEDPARISGRRGAARARGETSASVVSRAVPPTPEWRVFARAARDYGVVDLSDDRECWRHSGSRRRPSRSSKRSCGAHIGTARVLPVAPFA